MKILIDQAMPYWSDFFSSMGEVVTFSAGDLALDNSQQIYNMSIAKHLSDTECLLVRSTTKVNEALLAKMPKLRFVATATAGYDHLDIPALKANNINWYAAGGCNAQAVAQYVVCALLTLATQDGFLLKDKVLAVVGNGNVGSKVAIAAKALGAQIIIYDPPQQEEIKTNVYHDKNAADYSTTPYVNFEEVLKADIICMHAPFNSHASFPSKHLFDARALSTLTSSQYLINAGRGELIDNDALFTLFSRNQQQGIANVNVVLDVWESEPNIMVSLIPFLRLASAHIAGHSLEGKANGTSMLYKELCRLYNLQECIELSSLLPIYEIHVPESIINEINQLSQFDEYEIQEVIKKLCHFVYDIQNDDRVFRHHMSQFTSFAKLRQEYPVRREFSALKLKITNTKINGLLQGIGFIISNDSITTHFTK